MSYPAWFPVLAVALWAWMSLGLIGTLWLTRPSANPVRKVFWSVVLLLPILGWTLYGAFFSLPKVGDGSSVNYESSCAGTIP